MPLLCWIYPHQHNVYSLTKLPQYQQYVISLTLLQSIFPSLYLSNFFSAMNYWPTWLVCHSILSADRINIWCDSSAARKPAITSWWPSHCWRRPFYWPSTNGRQHGMPPSATCITDGAVATLCLLSIWMCFCWDHLLRFMDGYCLQRLRGETT